MKHSQSAVPTAFLPEAQEQTVLRAAAGERTEPPALAVVQPSRRVAASEPSRRVAALEGGKGRGMAAVLGPVG